jgi:hypothetical protein
MLNLTKSVSVAIALSMSLLFASPIRGLQMQTLTDSH